ncbi:MAG: phosphoribosylglycinamide formyltransferase [Armatimonadota bacterium]|nr:phosphoribosylglycinamide formyltransferase [Armatimonadota bacterium]
MRIGVLVSGYGSNLQALLDAAAAGAPYTVAVVIANIAGAPALERARRAGVPAHLVEHRGRSRREFEADLLRLLREARVDLVCLAGFLRILSPWFVSHFRGRILNIHPALLPAFGGRGMYGLRVHEAVLASGALRSGCTVHLVDETVDGGPILAQATVPVLPGDTPETLAARVAQAEHRLYPEVVGEVASGRLLLKVRVAPAAGG